MVALNNAKLTVYTFDVALHPIDVCSPFRQVSGEPFWHSLLTISGYLQYPNLPLFGMTSTITFKSTGIFWIPFSSVKLNNTEAGSALYL